MCDSGFRGQFGQYEFFPGRVPFNIFKPMLGLTHCGEQKQNQLWQVNIRQNFLLVMDVPIHSFSFLHIWPFRTTDSKRPRNAPQVSSSSTTSGINCRWTLLTGIVIDKGWTGNLAGNHSFYRQSLHRNLGVKGLIKMPMGIATHMSTKSVAIKQVFPTC